MEKVILLCAILTAIVIASKIRTSPLLVKPGQHRRGNSNGA
jgi:hypothetical protein